MSIKNAHISKYIADYYCKTAFPPGFAVLIAETAIIRQRVNLAAARADLPVSVSCFCARGKAA